MSKSTFDPTFFNFDKELDMSDSDYIYWSTNPQPNNLEIGMYSLRYIVEDDWWTLYETVYSNDREKEITIYSGHIPDNKWGFELLKNMEILLPVIQRDIKIENLDID